MEGGVVMRSRRWWQLWLVVPALLAVGTPVQAHLMNTGFGPFYDGLTHPFVTPEDLLPVVVGLAMVLGLAHGWMNGAGLAQAQSGALGMVGIISALFVIVALLAGPVVALHAAWARVVVRVAGSWITAIGLLMLGWTVRAANG